VQFSFLNDCDGPNAYATPDTHAILFGINLGNRIYAQFGSALPLWQVIAHEFGHQVQFALGDDWLAAPTAEPKELEADMFSGFYLILAKSSVASPAEMQTTLNNAFSIGDFQFNSPSHHGTPLQRVQAVLAGAKVGTELAYNRIAKTYPAVRQRFAQELALII
jgi:uncharacterized protein